MQVHEYSVRGIEDAFLQFSKALGSGEKYILGSGFVSRTGGNITFQMEAKGGIKDPPPETLPDPPAKKAKKKKPKKS